MPAATGARGKGSRQKWTVGHSCGLPAYARCCPCCRGQPAASRRPIGRTVAGKARRSFCAETTATNRRSSATSRPGATIDAQQASFTVANSRNGDPDFILSCKVGTLPTNSYPVVIRNSPGVRFIGGRFDGQVPLSSDWRQTYCNSAALLLKDGTTSATIEGVRARRCWDGIRFADQADGFRLKASWLIRNQG